MLLLHRSSLFRTSLRRALSALNEAERSIQDDYFSSSSSQEEEIPGERHPDYHISHLIKEASEIHQERAAKLAEAQYGADSQRRLVKRPQRGFLWGLGAQLYHEQQQSVFSDGQLPTIRQLIKFLTVHQAKDVTVFHLRKLGWNQLADYSIVCTGYSPRHLHKIARQLVVQVKDLGCSELKYTPSVYGRKEDEWLMVRIQDVSVNMLTEQYREEIDLETRYTQGEPTDEEMDEIQEDLETRKRATLKRKGRN